MNPECPFCKVRVDKHEVSPCGDAWMARLLEWGVHVKLAARNKYYLYEDSIFGKIPPFTTSLDAQAEHVWPVILETTHALDLEWLPEYKRWCSWAKPPIKGHYGFYGRDEASPALASWRACIQYFEGKKDEKTEQD